MITASNLKRGVVFRAEGHLYQVMSAEHHMGGGKMGGVEHLRLKDLESGGIVERRFRPEEKIEPIEVEKRKLEYLDQDGDFQVFMDLESYEQFPIPAEMIGDKHRFLSEELIVTGQFLDMRPLNIEFPEWVDLRVTVAPPPLHEQDSTTGKTVRLENNMEILAPQFIEEGDTVRVSVETGKYMERV
jgi:elongation factor P